MTVITLAVGWIITVFIGVVGAILIWKMHKGDIDLNMLISEPDSGDASLSRFQFLIFTFVIALSLFLVIVGQDPPHFPNEIPAGIFALIGISSGSYLISKAIQTNRDTTMQKEKAKQEKNAASGDSSGPEEDKGSGIKS